MESGRPEASGRAAADLRPVAEEIAAVDGRLAARHRIPDWTGSSAAASRPLPRPMAVRPSRRPTPLPSSLPETLYRAHRQQAPVSRSPSASTRRRRPGTSEADSRVGRWQEARVLLRGCRRRAGAGGSSVPSPGCSKASQATHPCRPAPSQSLLTGRRITKEDLVGRCRFPSEEGCTATSHGWRQGENQPAVETDIDVAEIAQDVAQESFRSASASFESITMWARSIMSPWSPQSGR